MTLMRLGRQLLLFLAAAAAGYLLYVLNTPIPFMLGAMLVGVLGADIGYPWNDWPVVNRNMGLMVVGYAIGSFVTLEACRDFAAQAGMIVLSTFFMIGAGILVAWIMARTLHEDFMSCILGMMPGGMSLVMVICQENKRYDPNVVMVMQIIRFFGVVFTLPFLIITLFDVQVSQAFLAVQEGALHWLWFLPLALSGVLLFTMFHIPIPWLLGPVVPTALCIIYYCPVSPLPKLLLWMAQICVGLSMGMLMDLKKVWRAKRLLPMILLGTVLLIIASYVMALIIRSWYGVDIITGFLAMSPGGISEMNLAGLSVGAHCPTILAYQLLRVYGISWVIPVLVKFEKKFV